jgi:sulfofructose kinase
MRAISRRSGGNALNATIGIVRLGGQAAICGPMGDSKETSSRYIFEQMAYEGIDTSRLVQMEGLVTPISSIMIDPSGERTIVTFRDPDLWRVKLPSSEALLRRHPHREPLRGILHRSLRRGGPARRPRGGRCRSRHVTAGGAFQRLHPSWCFPMSPYRRPPASARRARRLKKLAKLTASFLAATRGPRGTTWLDEAGQLQETPAISTQSVRWAPATSSMAPSGWRSPRGRSCGRRSGSPPRAAALKCTRFGGTFAAPQRAEVEELLRQDRAASGARESQ